MPSRDPKLSAAAALAAFVAVKSLVTILLDACGSGPGGFPFVFQTVLIPPFGMQVLFYGAQVCASRGGVAEGLRSIVAAHRAMLPAVFFSTMVATSTVLQTLSQSFVDASTFVVLMQLTLVFVACGERYILRVRSSASIWLLVCLQALCVSYFELSAGSPTTTTEQAAQADEKFALGVACCILASVSSAIGAILAQRFMQTASPQMSTNMKLLYQHVIGLALMALIMLGQTSARSTIWNDGFFHGWDRLVVLASVCMWVNFVAASAVTAYISAMAGAMGTAVVVVVVGFYDFLVKGKNMSPSQGACIMVIAWVTALYAKLKGGQSSSPREGREDVLPQAAKAGTGAGHPWPRGGGAMRIFRRGRGISTELFDV